MDGDIIEGIKPLDTSNIIIKRRDSALLGIDLDNVLRKLNVDTIMICRIDTSIWVETSLRDAFNWGYEIVRISDTTASTDPRRYERSLDDVRNSLVWY